MKKNPVETILGFCVFSSFLRALGWIQKPLKDIMLTPIS